MAETLGVVGGRPRAPQGDPRVLTPPNPHPPGILGGGGGPRGGPPPHQGFQLSRSLQLI